MSVKDVFEKLRAALDDAAVPYFVTGSFASSAHGVPRSTNDIDIVIAPTRGQLEELMKRLPASEFAAELEDALDALAHHSLFNVVDYGSMWKIDFIFKQPTPFDAARFSRRRVVEIAGVRLYAASPEDILLTKLWWAKLSESERQLTDAVGIVQVQGAGLDLEYVDRWVMALDLEREWAWSASEPAPSGSDHLMFAMFDFDRATVPFTGRTPSESKVMRSSLLPFFPLSSFALALAGGVSGTMTLAVRS